MSHNLLTERSDNLDQSKEANVHGRQVQRGYNGQLILYELSKKDNI